MTYEKKKWSGNKGSAPAKKTVLNRDSVLNFGKHKGSTIQSLLDNEETIAYVRWMSENIDRVQLADDILAEL